MFKGPVPPGAPNWCARDVRVLLGLTLDGQPAEEAAILTLFTVKRSKGAVTAAPTFMAVKQMRELAGALARMADVIEAERAAQGLAAEVTALPPRA